MANCSSPGLQEPPEAELRLTCCLRGNQGEGNLARGQDDFHTFMFFQQRRLPAEDAGTAASLGKSRQLLLRSYRLLCSGTGFVRFKTFDASILPFRLFVPVAEVG